MARSEAEDPLLSHCFYLIEMPVVGAFPIAFPVKTAQSAADGNIISFQSIELPEVTIKTKEIQAGNEPNTHHVLMSGASGGRVVIRQALTPIGLDFFVWVQQAINPGFLGIPRRHFAVVHTRADRLIPRRQIMLWDCIPVAWKPSTTLDANNSEVAMEEITLECHKVEVLPGVPI